MHSLYGIDIFKDSDNPEHLANVSDFKNQFHNDIFQVISDNKVNICSRKKGFRSELSIVLENPYEFRILVKQLQM